MKPFEFVLVIVSVIVGLALTEFAIGVADMIKIYKTANFYWPHIAVCGLGFMSCLNYWGTVYKLRHVTAWSIPSVGIVFTSGLIFFVITRLTFPDKDGFDQDYKRYFNENIRVILILMILFLISYMLESLLIRRIRKLKSYIMGLVFIMTIASGIIIENDHYRSFLTIILLILQIIYMYTTKVIIRDKRDEGAAVSTLHVP